MRLAASVAAFLLLSVPLSVRFSEPWSVLRPSVDVVALVGLAAAAKLLAARGRLLVMHVLGAALMSAVVYRFACEVFPRFFGRPLRVKHDLWLLPNLYDLLFDSLDAWRAGAALVAIVALLALGSWLSVRLLSLASRPLAGWRCSIAFVLVAVSAAVVFDGARESQLLGMSSGLAEAYSFYNNRGTIDDELERARSKALGYPTDLAKLKGADVYVFFLESYGRTLWRNLDYRKRFEPFLKQYDERLRDAGIHVASHFVTSPVKGGGSWLAHATFQSGVDCDNPICYERLLDSNLVPLTAYFRRRGYHTVSVMPAVDIDPRDWPAGEFFQFEEKFWQDAIGYQGPRFDWSPVPDQYTIHAFRVLRLDDAHAAPPVFAEFSLTTSHPPFRRVPPYFEGPPLLDKMLAFYAKTPWLRFDNNYDNFHEAAEGYTSAIRYSLRSVLDFVIAAERPALFIVLGDHQPIYTVQGPGGRQVPIHVMSRDRSLLEGFLEWGFRPGLMVRGGSRLQMSGLLEVILSACSLEGGPR